ncbi:hypothetical protein ACE1CA_20645 [Aerosakkonemataceae cyanobacterium BLCC-F167]|uniref:Uncharacterized protein n=1 Tax=Floridaenema evergladense BLCC-F167 TaxID=3153639 RepID=A0ABV4WPC0_9CYAN
MKAISISSSTIDSIRAVAQAGAKGTYVIGQQTADYLKRDFALPAKFSLTR